MKKGDLETDPDSKQKLATLAVKASVDAIVCSDESGLIRLWNPAAAALFGYSEKEALGEPLTILMSKKDKKSHTKGMKILISTGKSKLAGKTVEVSGLNRDGTVIPLELSLAASKSKEGWQFTAIFRDCSKRKQAEQQFTLENQIRLADAQRVGHIGNWEFDLIHNRMKFSDETYRIFGVPDDFWDSYKSFFRLVHPDDRLLVREANQKVMDTGSFSNVQYRVVCPDGSERYILSNGESERDESGTLIRIFGSIQDITERRRSEEELAESELRFRSLIEATTSIIWTTDESGGFVEPQASWEKFTGQPWSEHQGFGWTKMIHPDDVEHVQNAWEKACREQSNYNTWGRVWNANLNEYRHFVVNAVPVLRPDGSLNEWIGIIVDVSEQKQVENERERLLHDSSERIKELRCIYGVTESVRTESRLDELFQDVVNLIPPGWHYPEITRARIVYKEKAYVSEPFKESRWKQSSDIVIDGEVKGVIEVYYLKECPELDEGPFVKEERELLDGIGEAISQAIIRRSSEEAAQLNEERIRLLLDSTAEGIYGLDMVGNCTFANRACLKITGYEHLDELVGKNMHELIHHSHNDGTHYPVETCQIYRAFKEGKGTHVDSEVLWRKDGTSFPSEYFSYPITKDEAIIGAVVTFIDITERKQAEEQLRMLSSSVEQASEAILITDMKGDIRYINPAFTRLTGYSEEEATGKNPKILNSGSQSDAFYREMWGVINQGNAWQGRVVDRKRDGSFYPAMLTISPIKSESGEITHYVGIQQDLSDYEDLESQFHQAQKMEAMGTLVGGIAHDFNNMLAGMTGNLYLAKKKIPENPEVVKMLSSVEQLSFRAADMIQQLLTFARKGQVSMKQLPLVPFIKETLKLLRTSVPENIALHHDICSDQLLINGDGTQLHQVLMNLINNARDAIEDVKNPTIKVKLDLFEPDKKFIQKHPYFKTGAYACLCVEDNGSGIPEDQIEHLYEPFFTTKQEGKGTGLGLAMTFGAVKTHHGYIEVASRVGKGTIFHVYLPLLEVEGMISPSSDIREVVVEGCGETILLVDDDKQVLEIGREVLKSLGYRVLVASNGLDAIELFSAKRGEIALIIMDVVMPGLSGVKSAEQIQKIHPDVKIIFSTGYDKEASLSGRMASEEVSVLSKPYNINDLAKVIRERLESS